MVVIRLSRGGAKKSPFYHVVAANKSSPRDGKYIDRLGFFNPFEFRSDISLSLNRKKIDNWILKGARISDKVKSLLKQWDKKK